jgi:hypothetical protein
MRRPGLWVANGQPANPTQMLGWKPGAIGCMYDYLAANNVFNYKASNPNVPVIVRFQHPRDWHKSPAASAQKLGHYVAGKWNELRPLDPYVYFASQMNMHYENGDPNPANQHRYTTKAFYKKYADWVRITADTIKNAAPEMKLVTPPFAFGFNEDGSPDSNGSPILGWAGYDYLQETVQTYFDNTLTFHAYWGYPAGGSVPDWLYEPELSSWYAFRWQRVLQLFSARYGINAKMIIDEAGSFGPDDPDFTDQLIYYTKHCLGDPRVVALTFALWSDSTDSPAGKQNAWVPGVDDLDEHLQRLQEFADIETDSGTATDDVDLSKLTAAPAPGTVRPPVETPPPPLDPSTFTDDVDLSTLMAAPAPGTLEATVAPSPPSSTGVAAKERTIRVLMEDGTVVVMQLEEYLRGVVPGEVPALWPEEALKVQAVAARTYAQRAIDHPRHHPRADICTTVHCQHHDASRVHERTDEAIKATQGIILLHNGKAATAVYSARCGGLTRTNEDVWKSSPVSYLRSVSCPDTGEKFGHGVGMCQNGARVFAEQGKPFDEILKHYYQGITLGQAPD